MPVFAELSADGKRINIASEYRDRDRMKLVPGAKWDTEERTWWTPLSWAACVQLRGVFGQELQVGQNLGAWSRNEVQTRILPCLELRNAEDSDGVDERLYPFQRAGVMFMANAKQALNADEMGLGKTVQGIMALEQLGDDAYPALIVCPNSKKFDWAEERDPFGNISGGFAYFAPHRRVEVIHGGKSQRVKQIARVRDGEADVLVINWEGLRNHTRVSGYGSVNLTDAEKELKELNEVGLRSVIADEAHRGKDPQAKQTRALWWVGDHAEYRFALTGTPVANSPEDAWALMRFVSPLEFPVKGRFIDRYALQTWSLWGSLVVAGLKSETKDELFKILEPRMIRRTKKMVMPQLPEKVYTTRTIELVPKQRKAYDQLRKDMLAELDGGILLATNPLTRLTRLLQFASAHGEIDAEENLILTEPSCKVDALEEIVEELGQQQAVVFAESRQLIELAFKRLQKKGVSSAMLTGTVPPPERAENVQNFQSGKTRILLLTLGAGGEGLTLTAASVAIFLQRSFSAVKNAQAEDRIYGRVNDAHGAEIIDVIARDTVEDRIREVLADKDAKLQEIVRDEENLRRWLAK